ncbi:Crp/Fnr family transcriptional regulator [Nocardioides massiliensis]|uniref:CRP/FNR family transcriptional regulator n=1 Tax=Nocardioides massiliensis TaxID=1325935 RepID=A0ABT9NV08_9ACTN|nr:Crp/Fnr family transcriptional regulator [Nocardioides massiliensis]MDP9824117.1 CRP/FNR family transcriptional regulator [Nocardioides massiliensis]
MSRPLLPLVEEPGSDLCVARVPIFGGLDHADQVAVAAVARPVTLTKGEQVVAAGAPLRQLLVAHTGMVKVARITADGHEQIVRLLGPGDFFGESGFLTGSRSEHFVTAVEPASMCTFHHDDLHRLITEHPSIGWQLLRTVSDRLLETETRLAAVISGDVSARLAGYLLSLPGRHDEQGLQVQLPIAKKDIASLLDTTPESLSRQLRRLRDSGVVRELAGGRLLIADPDALMRLSEQP